MNRSLETFIQDNHRFIKMERQAEEREFRKILSSVDFEQAEKLGLILPNLKITQKIEKTGDKLTIKLGFSKYPDVKSNFYQTMRSMQKKLKN